jgi:hypothetical protein
VTQPVDNTQLVTLAGNTRPEANARNDRGPVPDNLALQTLFLQLRRPAELEQAFEELIDELHDPRSPNYHHWLAAQEVGERFGPAQQDVDTVASWLRSQGFSVARVYPSRMVIDFSGTAGQVRQAFHTEIHYLDVKGKRHIANMGDPQIPAALAPVVAGVVSLNDFMPRPLFKLHSEYTFTNSFGTFYAVVPADLATIYNFNPLYQAGYSGQGQTIVVIEDTDLYNYPNDWDTFRSTLGLASAYSSGSLTQTNPQPPSGPSNCSNPGVNGDDIEAALDVEWASAAAPSAAIVSASCATTSTNFGGFIALQNLVNSSTPPAIVSISYGASETDLGASANAAISSLYQQAVSEGMSIFVAAGDSGPAGNDRGFTEAIHGINVNGLASTPYNVAVGGTDFEDSYLLENSSYWSSTNTTGYGSALSYVPEIPWNDSCASELLAKFDGFSAAYGAGGLCNTGVDLEVIGGGGGPSGCASGAPATGYEGVVSGTCAGYPKPSWQSVLGNPADGVRDLPDVSLFAADGEYWSHSYIFCFSDTANGGASCSGAPDTWTQAGGTSFASPIMAGIQALINQHTGGAQGNPNPSYYAMARTEYGVSGASSCNSSNGNAVGSNCVFYDVTQGDTDQVCVGGINCYTPSGVYGVLSTCNTGYQPAYAAGSGWDFASGIGTVNVFNLVEAFGSALSTPGSAPTPTATPTCAGSATPTPTPTSTPTGVPATPVPRPTAVPPLPQPRRPPGPGAPILGLEGNAGNVGIGRGAGASPGAASTGAAVGSVAGGAARGGVASQAGAPARLATVTLGGAQAASGRTEATFGPVAVGASTLGWIAVENASSAVLSGTIEGFASGSPFELVSDAGPFQLEPGERLLLGVRFDPPYAGRFVETLRVRTGAGDEALLGVALSGVGR